MKDFLIKELASRIAGDDVTDEMLCDWQVTVTDTPGLLSLRKWEEHDHLVPTGETCTVRLTVEVL